MSNLTNQEVRQKLPPPLRDEKHRKFVASLPCLICGGTDVQCAHIPHHPTDPQQDWLRRGQKCPDDWTVPLCLNCHTTYDLAGTNSKRSVWRMVGVNPREIGTALYAVTGNEEAGRAIVEGARR